MFGGVNLTVLKAADGAITVNRPANWRGDSQTQSFALTRDLSRQALAQRMFETDDKMIIVDLISGEVQISREQPTGSALSFSPDGSCLLHNVGSDEFAVLATDSGGEHCRIPGTPFSSVAWSPDSNRIAVTQEGTFKVYDAHSGATLQTLLSSRAKRVAYASDGSRVVVGCEDGMLDAFDATSGGPQWQANITFDVANTEVQALVVSPDGNWVAAHCGNRLTVRAMDSGRSRSSADIMAEGFWLELQYSPSLRHVMLNKPDPVSPMTFITDAESGKLILEAPGISCFASDGTGIINAAGTAVTRFDLGLLLSERTLDAPVSSVAVSNSGAPLVAVADTGSVSGFTSSVTMFVAASGQRLMAKGYGGLIAAIDFVDNHQAVAIGGSSGLWLYSAVGDRELLLDDIGSVSALTSAGSDGKWVAVAIGKTVRLLASSDGSARWQPFEHPRRVTLLAASADGRWVATGSVDGVIRILDAATGTPVYTSPAPEGGVPAALAFQPGGPLVASAHSDGSVRIVDAENPESQPREFTRATPCTHVAVNADGALVAVADSDNMVAVYSLASSTTRPVGEIAMANPVTALVFNPADGSLVVATGEPTVTAYDPLGGHAVFQMTHAQPVTAVVVTADGTTIATAGEDVVRVWAY